MRVKAINITKNQETPADNERFVVRRGVVSWDTSQDFWEFTSRPSLCETPSERKVAGALRRNPLRSLRNNKARPVKPLEQEKITNLSLLRSGRKTNFYELVS